MEYTTNPDGTVNTVTTDDKSNIRQILLKYTVDLEFEASKDMQAFDSHKLFK